MKNDARNDERPRKADPVHLPASAKLIRKKSGKILKQYPSSVGYHGSGEERELNPEE